MPRLNDDDVHLWIFSLESADSEHKRLEQYLSDDEIRRVRRFHFVKDQSRFVVARGLLRIVLGYYVGVEPNEVRFAYGSKGKPMISMMSDSGDIEFNLSHSESLGLIAVARGRRVGVDIERIRPEVATESMARTSFSPRENALFRKLPEELRVQAFFNCWTRKEAFIKAVGEGVSYGLDQFDVSFKPGEAARFLHIRKDQLGLARWSLTDLVVPPGYAGALVIEGHDWQLSCFSWPPEWSESGCRPPGIDMRYRQSCQDGLPSI